MLALAGCAGDPEEPIPVPTSAQTTAPSPTPTPQYTPGLDPEADVQAAIETYEAYVKASNELVLADRATWDPVLELLAEPYRSESVIGYEQLAADGREFEGAALISDISSVEVQPTIVTLHACTDFSERRIHESDGTQVGDDSDYFLKSMNIVLQAEQSSASGWLIAHFGWSELSCD